VVPGVHQDDVGPGDLPHRPHPREGLGVGVDVGGQDHPPAPEQRREGGLDPALLGPGDRVAGYEAHRAVAEGEPRGLDDARLGAAHVGDHRTGSETVRDRPEHRLHREEGDRHHDHVGSRDRPREVQLEGIDHPSRNAVSRGSRRRPAPTTRPTAPASRRARASEPPMRPTPMMQSRPITRIAPGPW